MYMIIKDVKDFKIGCLYYKFLGSENNKFMIQMYLGCECEGTVYRFYNLKNKKINRYNIDYLQIILGLNSYKEL